jgi:hypothetical protein
MKTTMKTNLIQTCLLAAALLALPAVVQAQFTTPGSGAERQVLHGHLPAVVTRFSLQPEGRLASTNRLNLAIGLPLRNTNALGRLLHDIYDPASPQFHHYLTPAQFTEQFGPTRKDYEALVQFVKSHGLEITATHSNRLLVDVAGQVADVEKAFQVTLRTYRHPQEKRVFYAPDVEPTLDLTTPVLHISGLDNYAVPRPMYVKKTPVGNATGATPATGSGPSGSYMGNDFRAAYVPGVSLTGSGQVVGLMEFDGYYTNDISAYESQAGLPNVPLKNVLLDGSDGYPYYDNVEVALDIDMAICMAPGLSAVVVYEGYLPDSILNRMASDNLAKQLSASWTYEIDPSTEQIFQQFAAQGQSFFNASGDYDAWVGYVATPCDDPYITIIGGTTLTTTGPGGSWVSETVWNWGNGTGGGGGISTTYPIPAWQQGIDMTANHGSTTMRNLPDVALTADNVYVIADNGSSYSLGGTSCATPLWAAFIALVNQQALASSNSPAGFINPAIYTIGTDPGYAATFHDITTGNNAWYDSSDLFHAVPGYDLCTGWGTPAGTNLIKALAMPEALQITPRTDFSATGKPGGPFNITSQNFTLTNAGAATLDWTLANTSLWLSPSPSGGTLTPGGPATSVTASLNSAAYNLPVGVYAANIRFINLNDVVVQSRQFNLTVINPPAITAQPTNQTTFWGATATFTVGASGGLSLFYQWQANGINLTDGGKISGSTTSTLTVDNISIADAGPYSVIVSNAVGAVSSSTAFLKVISSSPIITLQPANQSAVFGSQARFTVGAVGNHPLFYQWQFNETNLTDAGNISGSATTSLTISNVSSSDIGTYSVVVSNALGSVTSTGAVLAVVVVKPSGQLVQNGSFETGSFSAWSQSGNFAGCSVSTSFTYVHSGTYGALLGPVGSLGYLSQSLPTVAGQVYLLSLWLDSPDGLGPNEFKLTWDGNALFDQTNLTAIGWTNLQFIVAATGTNTILQLGFQDDQSFLGLDDIQVTPLVSADGPPIIATQPANQFVQSGSNATFSVFSAGRLPLFYQWSFNGTNIAWATNSALTLTNAQLTQAGDYNVWVSNSLDSATSSNALLTVLLATPRLITFDDLTGDGLAVPVGYNNLTWSNFYYLDGLTYGEQSGYTAGVVSSPNVAYNSYGMPAAISSPAPFNLVSAYLTAAWINNLRVELKGYSGPTLVYDSTYILSMTVPRLVQFNRTGVTSVQFISTDNFVMDNLSLILFQPPSPPVVTTQPIGQIASVGGTANFKLVASGSPPLSYLWSRNGSPIAGATNSIYTTNNVQLSDSGSQFSCLVTNAYGSMVCSNAILTVHSPFGGGNGVAVFGASGDTTWNNDVVNTISNTLVFSKVSGFLASQATPTLAQLQQYAAVLVYSDASFYDSVGMGNVLADYVDAGGGVVVATFGFNSDGYGLLGRLVTGGYLPLTTGEQTSGTALTFVADQPNHPILNGVTSFNGGSSSYHELVTTTSGASLVAHWTDGQPLVATKQLTAGRVIALNFYPPSSNASSDFWLANTKGGLLMANALLYAAPVGPVITAQPSSQTLSVGSSATFSVTASGPTPLRYFWSRNGSPIAGATLTNYTINNVQLSDSGSQFSCLVSNAYGTATSSNALLVVVPSMLAYNGGFETGDFSLWTMSGNLDSVYGLVTTNSSYVHTGKYGAQLGPVGSLGYLSQTLTTSIGQVYLVSFWLNSPNGAATNEFLVTWNGNNLWDQVNVGATGWTNLQFFVTAAANNTILEFGLRNDPSYFGLDDIVVYPITPPQVQTVTMSNGTISFSWSALTGLHYQMQYTTDLASANWTNLASAVTAIGATLTATDSVTNNPQRFYRLVLLP